MLAANRTSSSSELRAFLTPITVFHLPDFSLINAGCLNHLATTSSLPLPRTSSLNPGAANVSTSASSCIVSLVSASTSGGITSSVGNPIGAAMVEISEALRAELSPRCGLVRSGMDHVNDFQSFAGGITYTHGGSNLLCGS